MENKHNMGKKNIVLYEGSLKEVSKSDHLSTQVDCTLKLGLPGIGSVEVRKSDSKAIWKEMHSRLLQDFDSKDVSNSSIENWVKHCELCKTTETPCWRNGDNGEKLCNACGLRVQRKRNHA